MALSRGTGITVSTGVVKRRHAVRAEPMSYLACAVNEWRMVSTVCNWDWSEWMNYLYLVFKLGRTTKTSHTPCMFCVEDTFIYLLPPLLRIFLPSSAVSCLGDI